MGADLITLNEYKTSENLSSLENDSRLESLIASISQLVKTYCGNSFIDYVSVDKVEEFSLDYYTPRLQVTESPLISVSTVQERSRYGADYVTLDENNYEYYVDAANDLIVRTSSNGYVDWPQGPGCVIVTYRAGYQAVPEDLKLAVIDLVNYYYKDEYKPRRTIGSSSMTNDPSSTQWRNVGFPDHIKRVLDLYKQIQV